MNSSMSEASRLNLWLQDHQHAINQVIVAAIGVILLASLLMTPIVSSDMDTWVHLTGGKYLFENGEIYPAITNSFASEFDAYVNYTWGFQGLIYSLWQLWGFVGLIVLRALLVSLSCFFLLKILLQDQPVRTANYLQLTLVTLGVFLLSSRGIDIRPHFLAFLYLPLLIYVLFYKEKWFPILPLLAVCWVNTHGITWVLAALASGAYLLNHAVSYVVDHRVPPIKHILWIFACIPALFLNPYGYELLLTPFLISSAPALYIAELSTTGLSPVLDLSNGLDWRLCALLLVPFFVLGFGRCVLQPREHLVHLILAAGGVYLLFSSERFVWEWLLLSAPLLATGAQSSNPLQWNNTLVILVTFVLFVESKWSSTLERWARFPFDEASVAKPTSDFIDVLDIKGRYLLSPGMAGYVEWRLSLDIQILADMQQPPFRSETHLRAITFSRQPQAFKKVIEDYRPDLLGIKQGNSDFPSIIAAYPEAGYVPVHFDSRLVIYINRFMHPEIADKHELKTVNPYAPLAHTEQDPVALIKELNHMLTVVPDNPLVTFALVRALTETGELAVAQNVLQQLESSYRNHPVYLLVAAQLARAQGNLPIAIEHYLALTEVGTGTERADLALAECYFLLGEHDKAVTYFAKSVNPYARKDFELHHLYSYAISLSITGDEEHALRMLDAFELRDDHGNDSLSIQAQSLRATIEH